MYQDLAPIRDFDGRYPVIGSWVLGNRAGDASAGIGMPAFLPATAHRNAIDRPRAVFDSEHYNAARGV